MPDIHAQTPTLTAGRPLETAKAALIVLHGRGGSPDDMLELVADFGLDTDAPLAILAPQAAHLTWYPQRFTEIDDPSDPHLIAALNRVGALFALIAQAGIAPENIILLGFSQGACLTLEYAARHAGHFGGVIALSGGLIGRTIDRDRYGDQFVATPIFLGCSDVDPHIPLARVQDSAALLRTMGGQVTERIYPNMGHTVNSDEIVFIHDLLTTVTVSRPPE